MAEEKPKSEVALKKQPSAPKKQPSAPKKQPSALKKQPSALKKQPSALKRQPSAPKKQPSAKLSKIVKPAEVKTDGTQPEKTKKIRKRAPRNYDLGNGIMRFSRSRMFHKRGKWKFIGKRTPKQPKVKKSQMKLVKPTGDKKGDKPKLVILQKRKKYFPTTNPIKKHPSRQVFSKHKRYLKSSLQPGTVCILLAGRHKGKRVVMLKQLSSGFLLITGPHRYNGCPLKRMNQIYVIGTKTKIDMTGFTVPKHITDDYFKRVKQRKKSSEKKEGDIFKAKVKRSKVSAERKADQLAVDSKVITAIKKREDRKHMFRYLGCMFGLRNRQFPHNMKF